MTPLSLPAIEWLLFRSCSNREDFLQGISFAVEEHGEGVLRSESHEREAVLGVLRELSERGFIDIQRMPYKFENIDQTGAQARHMVLEIEAAWPPTATCWDSVGWVFEVGPTEAGVRHAKAEYNRRQAAEGGTDVWV